MLGPPQPQLELLGAHEQGADRVRVEHAHAPFGDGADAELGIAGRADLAHEQDVERGPERSRDLVAHRDAAARKGQHHRVLGGERPQRVGERRAGLAAVAEDPRGTAGGGRRGHRAVL